MSKAIGRIAAIAVFLIAQAALANAAELKVFSTIGVQAALEELTPKFEKATGNKLTITWGTAAMLVKRVQGGENPDLLVLTKQGFDALVKDGKAVNSTDAVFASSGMALVVKKGAPKPDISTPENTRRRCSRPKRSPIRTRRQAARAASFSPKRSSAWVSPTQ